MEKSNISFSSNVNIIRSDSYRKGDTDFLRKVKEYYALEKLRIRCGYSMNSSYYMFSSEQMKILSPDFFDSYMSRKKDKKIEKENEKLNEEYGYERYCKNKTLYPLIDEFEIPERKSKIDIDIWEYLKRSNDKNDDLLGYWKPVAEQVGTVEVKGGGSLFTTYVKQEVKKKEGIIPGITTVPIEEADLSEFKELDPFYYIYQKTAGITEDNLEFNIKNVEAKGYLQKYGIYSAFESVEQEDIIEAPVDANIFVDAGPGTGKTYTLINKINYMVEELDVDPEGILVLCFTNAAVAEIKKRRDEYIENGGSRGLRKVDIRTFHSFAWWLINEANENFGEEDGWKYVKREELSYDGSIVKATSIINKFSSEVLGNWEHFIVDEIQDLTDVRARLVLQIIKSCLDVQCGFTVLGDSCQAIYDYNQQDVIDPLDSIKFYRTLFMMLFGKASFYKLNLNHRQTDSLIGMTSGLREAILNEKMSEMKRAVRELYYNMDQMVGHSIALSVSEKELNDIAGDGKVCLLCRNNGQVLRLSTYLRKRGIKHMVNAYDHNRCYAAWIGQVFSDFSKEMINEEEFEELYGNQDYDSDFVWERIATMLGKPDNFKLGTNEILTAIYNAQIDDPIFFNRHDAKIIVSNIHKAKGREYEAVMVEQNFIKGLISKKKDIGEYKTLYVAVTRPKTKLFSANMVSGDNVRVYPIFNTGRKRWIKQVNRELKYMEIRGNIDIDINSYNLLGKEVQEYIRSQIIVGDEIILVKSQPNENFHYKIMHIKDEMPIEIGRCTRMMEDDIEALVGTEDYYQWPAEIRELYVTEVYTYISDIVKDDKTEIGIGNVWNWVDFCGLGRLVYDVY